MAEFEAGPDRKSHTHTHARTHTHTHTSKDRLIERGGVTMWSNRVWRNRHDYTWRNHVA